MYVTLDQVKTRLGITDTTHDDALNALIPLVCGALDAYSGRDFAEHTVVNEYSTVHGKYLYLEHYPVQNLSMEYMAGDNDDPQWTAISDIEYTLSPNIGVVLFDDKTYDKKRVRSSYTGGYYEIPSDVREALLTFIARIWQKKIDDGKADVTGIQEGITIDDVKMAVTPAEQSTVLNYLRSI